MKTTIELPDDLLHRAKIVAAQRQTTLKELITVGLDWVLRSETSVRRRNDAVERLRKGLQLGGTPLRRQDVHGRR